MKGCYKALKTRLINMKNGKKASSLETTYGDSVHFSVFENGYQRF